MKLFAFFLIIIGIGYYAFQSSQPTIQPTQAVPSPTTTVQPLSKQTVSYSNVPYTYEVMGPVAPSSISLHSNLPAKKTSTQLKEQLSCASITSAGFYSTNNTHIGLFVSNDRVIQEQSNNALFNQYVWATKTNNAGIGQLLPDEPLSFALQTGPLLIENSQPRTLRLREDEEARRIAVGISKNNQFVFYAITQENSSFTGPLLKDLPAVIAEVNKKETLEVDTVVNLDGGNHSTFQTQDATLLELSPVGGIFCIK